MKSFHSVRTGFGIITRSATAQLPVVVGLTAFLLLPTALAADEVHLANGRTIEGVIAEIRGDEVVIRLPGGQLVLPRSQVRRVVNAPSTFRHYLDRRTDLDATDPADAAEWLALARWAHAHEARTGYQEAALTAARLDPDLPGLAAIMRDLEYVYDARLERWVQFAEYQRSRGLVEVDGVWVPRSELERQRTAQARAEAARRANRRLQQLTQTIGLLALTQAIETLQPPEPPPIVYATPVAFPVVVVPGAIDPVDLELLSRRIPGSRIPIHLPGVEQSVEKSLSRHHTGVRSSTGQHHSTERSAHPR